MTDTERLAALLHAYGCRTKHHRPLPWCEVAATHLLAAGVTLAAPPSDPAAPLDVERFMRAQVKAGLRGSAWGTAIVQKVAREYAALAEETT